MKLIGAFFLLLFGEMALAQSGGSGWQEGFKFTSGAFKNGGLIPAAFTCDGEDNSPPLSWKNPPPGTKSFALILEDPDAPAGTWIHWVVYDIPENVRSLKAALAKKGPLANGALLGASWGVDAFEREGYWGPCPPPGRKH